MTLMALPYLIPSNPAAKDFVAALERAAQDGRPVELERLSGGGETYTFTGCIVSVTSSEDRCLVRRGECPDLKSYWIRYLFRMVDADGTKTDNRAALAKHQEVLERREQRATDGQRALVDMNFVPIPALVTSGLEGKTTGSINGKPCEFYVFKGRSSKPALAVVFAKSEQAAVRCMGLLDSENSTWDVFASYLQAHFLWPAWLNLREEAQERATAVRAGLPILPADAAWDLHREREKLYETNDLGYNEFGPTASVFSLEGEVGDFESLFALADRVPATLLNLYLIVAFDSAKFFDEIDRVDSATLKQFMHYDLSIACPEPTADEALETMTITRLRELVEIAGTGVKAKGSAALREHLKTCMTPSLERETVRRAKYKKYQLLPPPGWTWEQFQFLRSDYRFMLNALSRWMFNGWAPPAAAKRFTTLT